MSFVASSSLLCRCFKAMSHVACWNLTLTLTGFHCPMATFYLQLWKLDWTFQPSLLLKVSENTGNDHQNNLPWNLDQKIASHSQVHSFSLNDYQAVWLTHVNKWLAKPFEQVHVSVEWMTKPFKRADVSNKRVTKLFEQAYVSNKLVKKRFSYLTNS